jgi:hypothetical protein
MSEHEYLANAEAAERKAAAIPDPSVKAQMLKVAAQWRDLAKTTGRSGAQSGAHEVPR